MSDDDFEMVLAERARELARLRDTPTTLSPEVLARWRREDLSKRLRLAQGSLKFLARALGIPLQPGSRQVAPAVKGLRQIGRRDNERARAELHRLLARFDSDRLGEQAAVTAGSGMESVRGRLDLVQEQLVPGVVGWAPLDFAAKRIQRAGVNLVQRDGQAANHDLKSADANRHRALHLNFRFSAHLSFSYLGVGTPIGGPESSAASIGAAEDAFSTWPIPSAADDASGWLP